MPWGRGLGLCGCCVAVMFFYTILPMIERNAKTPTSTGYRLSRLSRRPWWSWLSLAAITVLATALFMWSLSRNSMGNTYYAAAVKSATLSWKAWFLGCFDPNSFITVDKLPASLWVQGLFARVFGFSSWSILLPQALGGVASVLILHHLVRRWQGEIPALLASVVFALTPVAVAVFRLNLPDALLTLLFLLAAWALWGALEDCSTAKLVLSGVALGFAFLTKMMEALLVVPTIVLVYLVCGPGRVGRRLVQLLATAAAMLVSAGWYLAVVELWPRESRPHIGGSADDTIWGLIFSRSGGYLGTEGPVPNFAGAPGLLRLLNHQFGGQIGWLVPLALLGLVAGLWWTRSRTRVDRERAGFLLWGSWLVVAGALFSLARGVVHPYYAVVLAPAVAALVGGGGRALWHLGKEQRWLSWLLPAGILGTGVLAYALLNRTPGYAPGLSKAVLVLTALGAGGLFVVLVSGHGGRTLLAVTGVVTLVGLLAGPAAYSLSTVGRGLDGTFATAGPEEATQFAFNYSPEREGPPTLRKSGESPGRQESPSHPPEFAEHVDKRLVEFLVTNKGEADFLVATQGALVAAPFIIATGQPVLVLGGYDGSYPVPSMAEFEHLVRARKVRFVLLGGLGAYTGGFGQAFSISLWVKSHGKLIETRDYGGYAFWCSLYQLW